jgi:hypothetical protein
MTNRLEIRQHVLNDVGGVIEQLESLRVALERATHRFGTLRDVMLQAEVDALKHKDDADDALVSLFEKVLWASLAGFVAPRAIGAIGGTLIHLAGFSRLAARVDRTTLKLLTAKEIKIASKNMGRQQLRDLISTSGSHFVRGSGDFLRDGLKAVVKEIPQMAGRVPLVALSHSRSSASGGDVDQVAAYREAVDDRLWDWLTSLKLLRTAYVALADHAPEQFLKELETELASVRKNLEEYVVGPAVNPAEYFKWHWLLTFYALTFRTRSLIRAIDQNHFGPSGRNVKDKGTQRLFGDRVQHVTVEQSYAFKGSPQRDKAEWTDIAEGAADAAVTHLRGSGSEYRYSFKEVAEPGVRALPPYRANPMTYVSYRNVKNPVLTQAALLLEGEVRQIIQDQSQEARAEMSRQWLQQWQEKTLSKFFGM